MLANFRWPLLSLGGGGGGGLPRSAFINGHNFLTLLSGGRYFQGVVTFRILQ